MSLDLTIGALANAYRSGALSPAALVENLLMERRKHAAHNIWISEVPDDALRARAHDSLVKTRTHCRCTAFRLRSRTTSITPRCRPRPAAPGSRIDRPNPIRWYRALLDAGAIALGKTNLDQFATGLVGTRSPYGICTNAFDPAFISGGSSSGSAVAVALGLASFSLGTDTAGSAAYPPHSTT
jgi:allophanate hydrolase